LFHSGNNKREALVRNAFVFFSRFGHLSGIVVPVAGAAAACSGTGNVGLPEGLHADSVATSSAALATEDGLADAYALFKSQFTGPNLGFDKVFPIGYGYHPGLSTEKLSTGGLTPKGQAKITFAVRDAQGNITTNGSITATLEQIPSDQGFDLWFVKNIAGSGRTVAPETGDTLRKVGSFTGTTQFGGKSLSVVVSPQSNSDLDIFDLDMVVITRLLGDGSFNVQPVIEAADTSPNFHNNARATIEDAVAFYTSDTFRNAPNGLDIQLSQGDINNIGAFLRVLNAAENIRQVRKRVNFVLNNRSNGNTEILTIAINDTQDALNDLSPKGLNPTAQRALVTIKLTLQTAQANADAARPPFMSNALVWLDLAKNDLFTANPNNEF
jgi:hypothetical protein